MYNTHKCTKVFLVLIPPDKNICKGFVKKNIFCMMFCQQLFFFPFNYFIYEEKYSCETFPSTCK
jgi:hypothetical protein